MPSSSSFLQIGQCSPHVHFSSADLFFCGLSKTIAWGIACTLVVLLFSLLSLWVFAWGNWPICPGFKWIPGGWHGVTPRGVFSDLEGWGIGYSFRLWWISLGGRRIFLNLGPSCGVGSSFKFSFAKLYTVTRMDMAADFTMGIWLDAVDVAAVGVGIGFTGTDVVGIVGEGWEITLTLYLLFKVLWFSSSYQPFWVLGPLWLMHCCFGKECWCMVVIGFGFGAWVWAQACPPILGMFSSFR